MSVLFTFPGQGAQKPGMLHRLPQHASSNHTLEQASDTLGQDVRLLDSAEALQSTVAVQLCLLIAGVAAARYLAAHGAQPAMVAGLSIGAYPAAVMSGVLDFADALRLVRQRAQSMEEAYPHGYGMTAVTGLTPAQLTPLIAEVHSPEQPVYLANLNGPRQLVLAGADAAMAAVAASVQASGAGAKTERLAVSVPSHCELFAAQAVQLAATMATITLRRPQLSYISASAGRALFDAGAIGADLAHNMARPVRWDEAMRHAWERGARLVIEMPSGSVLTRLAQPMFDSGMAISCDGARMDDVVRLVLNCQS